MKVVKIIFEKSSKDSGNGPEGKWQIKKHLFKNTYGNLQLV
jgi:hypothetical protein